MRVKQALIGVTCGNDNDDGEGEGGRPGRLQPLDKCFAVHAGHSQIEQNERGIAFFPPGLFNPAHGLQAVCSLDRLVAAKLERPGDNVAYAGIVVDNQHDWCLSGALGLRLFHALPLYSSSKYSPCLGMLLARMDDDQDQERVYKNRRMVWIKTCGCSRLD